MLQFLLLWQPVGLLLIVLLVPRKRSEYCWCTLLHYNSYVFYSLLPRICLTLFQLFIACNFMAIVSAIFAYNRIKKGFLVLSFIYFPLYLNGLRTIMKNFNRVNIFSRPVFASLDNFFQIFLLKWRSGLSSHSIDY